MEIKNKKYSLGVAALVVILGVVAILVSSNFGEEPQTEELMGSADDELTVDEIGPPPTLVIDPEVSLSGALTPDGNFYQFERTGDLPDEDDLNFSSARETWTPIVFDGEYDSIVEFLNENTSLTDQLTLSVIWDAEQQDWDVYPNEIFRSDYDIDTLDIFDDEFDGTLIFNTSRAYEYETYVEDRVGDFKALRGWNYGPKPDFSEISGKAVIFWTGDVTGEAERLTESGDLNDPIDRDFFDDLDDDEVYWFYVKGNVTESCSDVDAFVCGVDGNTYQNSCKAEAEGVDVDYEGRCKVDRVALIGEIKDDTLQVGDTLELEFFESSSDNTPEDLDMDASEIDLDDNDSDLAIYREDGANYVFITAFDSSDVDLNLKNIEIDLGDKLSPGDYQLRIFDTFEREKVQELELDFEVEAADPTEGPALVLSADDEEARPGDDIDFLSDNGRFDRSSTFQNDKQVVRIFKCDNANCSSRTELTNNSEIQYSRVAADESVVISKRDGFEAGIYEVEIEDAGFVYDDGTTVTGDSYQFEVVADLASITYSLKEVDGANAVFQPNRLVSETDEAEILDNFALYEGGQETDASEYDLSFDDATKEVTLTLIGRVYENNRQYEVRVVEETNWLEEWRVNDSNIQFNGPVVATTYGPALVLDTDDDQINPSDVINLETGVSGQEIRLRSGASLTDAVKVFSCLGYDTQTCNQRAEVNVTVELASDGMSVDVSNFGYPNGGYRLEIEVMEDTLEYENGDVVTEGSYDSVILEQG